MILVALALTLAATAALVALAVPLHRQGDTWQAVETDLDLALSRFVVWAARVTDHVWHVCHPQANAFWDDVPVALALAGPVLADLPLLRTCHKRHGGCGAHVGAPCTTADGYVTRPHKARRQAKAATA